MITSLDRPSTLRAQLTVLGSGLPEHLAGDEHGLGARYRAPTRGTDSVFPGADGLLPSPGDILFQRTHLLALLTQLTSDR